MAQAQRPLSPHLQVYRWGLHMTLSILHRATGVALGAGTLLLAVWLFAAATSDAAFACVQSYLYGWFGRLVLFGFTWALMLHLCNGIRHLFWDMGRGYDLPTVKRSNILVLAGSVVLTLLVWVAGYGLLGGLGL
jgi:succinate dehydrogenase / fumarate reductase cytochrome b subunit